MSLRVSFELDENDLKHFRLIMRAARKAASRIAPEDIVAAAEDLMEAIGDERVPAFVGERLDRLRLMIEMLTDIDWRLPHREATRVLNALAYFTEPEDLIPDHIPGLGFLDDAIMIELVVRELRHEIEAYEDFRRYRERMRAERGSGKSGRRGDWLAERRRELLARMRRRKNAESGERSPRLFR
ncbi:MAG: YkvA family protein [Woeseiaceae bacterium]|nr:YkvA family protein [Woeseiaceae bacterium]